MLYLPFPILIGTAVICWMLSGRVQTRRLGGLASLAACVALVLVLAGRWNVSLPVFTRSYTWAEVSGFSVVAGLQLDGLNLLLSIILLGGGALVLWNLARSLSPGLVNYGEFFSALLLVLTGGLLALLSVDLLLLIFGWGVVVLGGTLARRASGTEDGRSAAVLALAQPGGLLLLGAILLFGMTRRGGFTTSILSAAPVNPPVFAAWVTAVAAAMGLPIFGRPTSDEDSPIQLDALLFGCGLPLLAGYSLLRLYSLAAFGPAVWPPVYYHTLAAIGAIGALCCAAAALQTGQLSAILGWQLSAQLGLMLLALGVADQRGVIASIALLVNAALTTLVAGLALSALVRRTGSAELGVQQRLGRPLVAPGIAYALAAASAVGIAPLWGFWARLWLLGVADRISWLLPVVILSSALLALSYLGPLALFWRSGSSPRQEQQEHRRALEPPLLIGATALALPGLLPTEMWRVLLMQAAVDTLPPGAGAGSSLILPDLAGEIVLIALVFLLVALVRWRGVGQQQVPFTGGEPLDPDEGTPLEPAALGFSLRGLALLAQPVQLHRALVRGLDALSAGLSWALQLVGGRYYLTGALMAMVILLILMIA
ncbi:MAG: hypothetical protein KatS3mg057_0882 [Herpetosiphonaceae bacterium]|nr:MAG: hypothetical protein KatS3mg057_0882 [Herpetosiphonaceae bacterium]